LKQAASGGLLALVLLTTALREVGGVTAAGWVAALALTVYLGRQWAALPRAGKLILLAALAAAAVAATLVPQPAETAQHGLRMACFYASLFCATGLLRGAAEGSALIARSGRQLLAAPAGTRYAALTFGANLFGLVLSFGTLQLLGSALRQGDARTAVTASQRRGLLAVLRGFAFASTWSPLSVVLALSLAAADDAQAPRVLPIAFATAMALLALGCLVDWREGRQTAAPPGLPGEGWQVQLRLLALVGGIVGLSLAVQALLAIRLLEAVILAVPPFAAAWMVAQEGGRGAGALRHAGRRLARQVVEAFPSFRMEVMILASASFAGTLVAEALPANTIAGALRALALPGEAVPALVMALMLLAGQLAINPVLTVTVLAAALPPPLAMGASPTAVAVAYMAGWGLCVGASPFTLTTLIIGRIAGESGRTVGLGWNGRFTALAFLLASLWLAALTPLLPA